MTATILKVSGAPAREAASAALRAAGISVVEVDDWAQAAEALRRGEATLVVCDAEAVTRLRDEGGKPPALPWEAARSLSHELRTPLSAMAGWLHLLETGKLDEAGLQKVIDRLRRNIDDQVRTIDRCLGTTSNQEKAPS